MSTPYVVQSGDWGLKIAKDHGFDTFNEIYNHPDNAEFRKKRPNPNKIYAGDVIMIPDKTPSGGGGNGGSGGSGGSGGGGSGGGGSGGGTTPPTTGKFVEAIQFDTLCSIAVSEGYANCAKLRGDPANAEFLNRPLKVGDKVHIPAKTQGSGSGATENVHTFQRKGKPFATIRFVHGSKDLEYKDDPELTHLDVSNLRPDMSGLNRQQAFANETVRQFEQNAHDDPDTFKVEVFDMRTKKTELPVELDALKPVYRPNGTVEKHEMFEGDRTTANTEANRRSLNVSCLKQGGTTRYRSCYLKLVTDDNDHGVGDADGRPLQTLLTTDMTEAALAKESAGDNAKAAEYRKVEILDQKVRAKYTIDGCPAPGSQQKCHVTCEVPVGDNRMKVKVSVHVLRQSRGGAGYVTVKQAEDWCRKYVRWIYAQANMSIDFVAPFVRLVEPPTNMIAVSSPNGRIAEGGKKMKVGIKINDGAEVTAEITTVANATPTDTANLLAGAIRAVVPGTVAVTVTTNPPNSGKANGSADILIGNPLTTKVELSISKNLDSKQKLRIGEITSPTVEEFNSTDQSHVGTMHERVLIKNYDTGIDRVDLFIVSNLSDGSWGEAFRPKGETASADQKPIGLMINSVVIRKKPITDDVVHTTFAHEMGHVLMDVGHITGEATELMGAGSPVGDNEKVVGGPKRISDPGPGAPLLAFNAGPAATGNPTTLLRTQNATPLTGW